MKGYFEGWYFKLEGERDRLALIVGFHRTQNGVPSASLQVVEEQKTNMFCYPFTSLEMERKPLNLKLDGNLFSLEGITLDIDQPDCKLKGELQFHKMVRPKYDIMGPFVGVPFLQCRHSVFSLRHRIQGSLQLNDKIMDFSNGIGYIEGDRGCSFPKEYFWTHCGFDCGSVMLSIATVPLGVGRFIGLIGFVFLRGTEYRFATYLGAKIVRLSKTSIVIAQGSYTLTICFDDRTGHPLKAPIHGEMNRIIRENLACPIRYVLKKENEVILDHSSTTASLELEYIGK